MKAAITKMSKSKNYFQAKKPAASFATALAFALALLLAFPKNAAAQDDINFWSDYPNEELADESPHPLLWIWWRGECGSSYQHSWR